MTATVARVVPSGSTWVSSGSRRATVSTPASTAAESGERPSPPPITTALRPVSGAWTWTGISNTLRSP